MICCETLRLSMAQWLSSIKEVITNTVFGLNTPPENSCSLNASEMQNLSSDSKPCIPPNTMSLEDSVEKDFPQSPSHTTREKDMEDSHEHETDVYRGLSPSSDNNKVTDGSHDKVQHGIQWKSCSDIPIETKSAQGVVMENELYIGGGYVSTSTAGPIVYKYNTVFDFWDPLPPCPLKRFGMTIFNNELVLVGGKEIGNLSAECTNKIASWDEANQTWNFSLPPMTFARTSPVVFSYDRYVIVAGGKKGSLDYNMEIFDSGTKRWVNAPPLPAKCFPHSSTVSENTWFLLQEDNNSVLHADIRFLIQQATGKSNNKALSDIPVSKEPVVDSSSDDCTNLWQLLPSPPIKPDLITTVCNTVLAVSHETNPIRVHTHIYNRESKCWCYANKLPNLCSSSSATADSQDVVFLFGGKGSLKQFSNKLYRVTLKTADNSQRAATILKPTLTFHAI